MKPEPTYRFSRFESKRDNIPQSAEMSWPQLVALLRERRVTKTDAEAHKNGPAFCGARFPRRVDRKAGRSLTSVDSPTNTSEVQSLPPLRAARYVADVQIAVLDFDGGAQLPAIGEGIAQLNKGRGCRAFLYSTFSHDPQSGAFKYRLVLPLSDPVIAGEWGDIWLRLSAHFDDQCDPSAKDASRLQFLPACPQGRLQDAEDAEFDGAPLDVSTLPELLLPATDKSVTLPIFAEVQDRYAEKAWSNTLDNYIQTASHRNDALNVAAVKLGGFVGAGRLDESEVARSLFDAARANGYVAKDGEREARGTINSGLRTGKLTPNTTGLPKPQSRLTSTAKTSPWLDSLGNDAIDEIAPIADSNSTITSRSVVIGAASKSRDNDAEKEDAKTQSEQKKVQANREKEQPRYETFSWAQMATLPRPQWLIQGLIVENTISMFTADSGSFKSFFALEMGLCIAAGLPFHGHSVKQGAVVYVAAEGFYTLYERARAWSLHNDCPLPEDFHILRVPVNVADARSLAAFVAQFAEVHPAFVVLDTLSQCAAGLNENSNEEMAGFTAGMALTARSLGAHVNSVHHNSKNTGAFRGAGALKANVDTMIALERPEGDENNVVFVRCEKQRGKPFAAFALQGIEIELPETDEYGERLSSLAFEACGDVAVEFANKNVHPDAQKANSTRQKMMEIFDEIAAKWGGGVRSNTWCAEVVEIAKICGKTAFYKHRDWLSDAGEILTEQNNFGQFIFVRNTEFSTLSTLQNKGEQKGWNSGNLNNNLPTVFSVPPSPLGEGGNGKKVLPGNKNNAREENSHRENTPPYGRDLVI